MEPIKEFEKIMAETTELALATSVNDIPNVRILNFVYSIENKTLYFQSKTGDQKEKEFEKNKNVAFTTIPKNGLAYVRVNNVIVKKSKKSIFDLKDAFAEKMPFYREFIEQNGNTMDLYEIQLSKVLFFPDPDNFIKLGL